MTHGALSCNLYNNIQHVIQTLLLYWCLTGDNTNNNTTCCCIIGIIYKQKSNSVHNYYTITC